MSCDALTAATAPSPITTSHCSASGARASCAFSAQTTSSQISTPGSATLAPAAVSESQPANVVAPKTMPIAIAPWTNSSARRTTPTWQTSNADSGPRRRATRLRRDDVEDRRAEAGRARRRFAGRGPGAGATKGMLIGDETPPIESSESWRDTCSGLSPTDARPWGPCCARDDDDPCGSPRLPRLGNFKIHVREPVREKIRGLVGAVHRADERARQALHGERELRQAPLARRHRRQPRARGDARRPQGDRAGRPGGDPARPRARSAKRSSAATSSGASTSRTCTSTSRRA